MHPVDRRILELCKSGFSRLKPLVEHYSQGSVYRHAKKLLQLGWLERRASYYRTTTEGLRQLEAAHSSRRWNLVEAAYPPLQKIPTSVHRALAELVLASVVCRQHGTREDRHPFFIAAGATFHWKTSLGEFLCQALGLDPGRHIVECGAETGQSLFVRRTGRGTFAYKRELLASPFLATRRSL